MDGGLHPFEKMNNKNDSLLFFDDSVVEARAILKKIGLSDDWVEENCKKLCDDIQALINIGWEKQEILSAPKIKAQIKNQIEGQENHTHAIQAHVQETVDLLLKNPDLISEDISPYFTDVLNRIKEISETDFRALAVLTAYKGHLRLRSLEAMQADQQKNLENQAKRQDALEKAQEELLKAQEALNIRTVRIQEKLDALQEQKQSRSRKRWF